MGARPLNTKRSVPARPGLTNVPTVTSRVQLRPRAPRRRATQRRPLRTPGSSRWTAKLTTTTGPLSATLTVLPRPRGRWAGTTAPERAARNTLGLSRTRRTAADATGPDGDRGVLDDADAAWLGASASGTTLAMNARIGPSATRA